MSKEQVKNANMFNKFSQGFFVTLNNLLPAVRLELSVQYIKMQAESMWRIPGSCDLTEKRIFLEKQARAEPESTTPVTPHSTQTRHVLSFPSPKTLFYTHTYLSFSLTFL